MPSLPGAGTWRLCGGLESTAARWMGRRARKNSALRGHLDVVERLIATGADINYTRPGGGTSAVYVASQHGHLDVLVRLVAAGADVNIARTDTGGTPLSIAAHNGHLGVVALLLSAPEVNVNTTLKLDKTTPLFVAAQKGRLDVVGRLLAAPGENVNLASNTGVTPLCAAVYHGHIDVVEKLLAAPGVDVNRAPPSERHHAAVHRTRTRARADGADAPCGWGHRAPRVDGWSVRAIWGRGVPIYRACMCTRSRVS